MKKRFRKAVVWLGSAVVAVLAVPAVALFGLMYAVSALVDRIVGREAL